MGRTLSYETLKLEDKRTFNANVVLFCEAFDLRRVLFVDRIMRITLRKDQTAFERFLSAEEAAFETEESFEAAGILNCEQTAQIVQQYVSDTKTYKIFIEQLSEWLDEKELWGALYNHMYEDEGIERILEKDPEYYKTLTEKFARKEQILSAEDIRTEKRTVAAELIGIGSGQEDMRNLMLALIKLQYD